jgi:Protein of unknown function (DUF1353)
VPFVPESIQLTEAGPASPYDWLMSAELSWTGTFRGKVGRLLVLASPTSTTTTDLASVPRSLTWLFPRYGNYTKAAVLHDHLCHSFAVESVAVYPTPADVAESGADPTATQLIELQDRSDADEIFRLAMSELGVPWARRWLMWSAVSWATLVTCLRTGRASKRAQTWAGRLLLAILVVGAIVLASLGTFDGIVEGLPGPTWLCIGIVAVLGTTALELAVLVAGYIAQGRWDRWLVYLGAFGFTAVSFPLIVTAAALTVLLGGYLLFEDAWSGFSGTRARLGRIFATAPSEEETPRQARVAAVRAS